MLMNSKMSETYKYAAFSSIELQKELLEFVEKGFLVEDGCYFLSKCFCVVTNATQDDFPDNTGYECFINSINVDDYVEDKFLEYGLCLVSKVFSKWRSMCFEKELRAILSMDEFGLKIKFHVFRNGESWLDSELEGYEEAVMLVSSIEENFLGTT
ncbi:hypothetical protein VT06_16765 [Arsukibacterium sp. MJ3]|nr:hypothetical protein VT06_16765 [Arsukibacterium sp. MJ3]